MKLDVGAFAFLGDKDEGVDSETLDVAVGARDVSIGEMPGNHVC